jgi:hypothetical protein
MEHLIELNEWSPREEDMLRYVLKTADLKVIITAR